SPEIVEWGPGYDRSSQTRDRRKQLYGQDNPPVETIGSEVSYLGIGAPWANAANTPFRFWKKESYEGGSNTPCIIHWPKGLKAKPGSITTDFAHVLDIMPTCLELTGATYPEQFNGHKLGELGGKSLLTVINGEKRTDTPEYFFEHELGRAVFKNNWKLVAHSSRPRQWELYNMENDIIENHNLASQMPEKVTELTQDWNDWAEKVGTKDFFERHLPKRN
ncbi:MAG: sulfatase-like hydrolase/transferase, partial [Sedimentisphaerales bacterium]|nr:sulfatase-like hydrolase/transferase [Sedimentisphaerales bacterium]